MRTRPEDTAADSTSNAPAESACCEPSSDAESCCAPSASAPDLREIVRAGYAKIARGAATGCCGPAEETVASAMTGGCCGPTADVTDLALEVGYAPAELAAQPEGTNLGLSCGNPVALATLKEGETVLDLGSGAGMDVYVAGPRVGPRGRVIGVDMTPDMLAKARASLATYTRRTGLANAEFRLGEIEHLPVADASVDVVISNCVINLSPDKPAVWREIARVLKPGGRVAVSDLALLRPLPAEVIAMVEALVGCVAGAVLATETERMARAAGLADVRLEPKGDYIRAMTSFQDPLYQAIARRLPEGTHVADFVTSLSVTARKP